MHLNYLKIKSADNFEVVPKICQILFWVPYCPSLTDCRNIIAYQCFLYSNIILCIHRYMVVHRNKLRVKWVMSVGDKMPPVTGWNLDFFYPHLWGNQRSFLQENSVRHMLYETLTCIYNKYMLTVQDCIKFHSIRVLHDRVFV